MPVFDLIAWLAVLWLLAPLAWPLSCRVWNVRGALSLPDGGWMAGRMLALATWTLLVFWVGHLGMAVRFSLACLLPLALISTVAWQRNRRALWREFQTRWRAIVAVELVFGLIFAAFFVLRCYWPDTGNGEKPMDIALIGACARADFLPPPNPYLGGARLGGYYYLGHLQTALLTDAIGSQARWTYNLMAATLPALCFGLLWPLASALSGRMRRGALVTLMLLTTGTLEPLRQWLEPNDSGVRAWPFGARPIDYFSTSRVIPNPISPTSGVNYTINEFPLFTFTYADLHAHFFAMPLSLLVICLGLSVWNRTQSLSQVLGENVKPLQVLAGPQIVARALICGVVLAALVVTNTWDIPAYWLFLALCWWIPLPKARAQHEAVAPPLSNTARKRLARQATETPAAEAVESATKPVTPLLRWVLAIGAMSAVLLVGAWPYLSRLHTNATKPTPLDLPTTPFLAWLLMWGVICGAWALSVWQGYEDVDASSRATMRRLKWLLLPLGIWVILKFGPSWAWTWNWPLRQPDGQTVPFAVTYGSGDYASILVLITLLVATARLIFVTSSARLALLCRLAFCGLVALLWSELTWAGFLGRSLEGATYHRQDTVFKFGLQGWYLIGIAAACAVLSASNRAAQVLADDGNASPSTCEALPLWRRWPWPLPLGFVAALGVMWLAAGACVWERARHFEFRETPDAWAHLAPPEREAAEYLQTRARDGDVLLEAEQHDGGDYSPFSRYAHATGVPTVIGPAAHTFQWGDGKRNDREVWDEVAKRKADVRNFYTQADAQQRQAIAQKYGVRFIVVGELEMQEYGPDAVAQLIAANGRAHVFGPTDAHRVMVIDLKMP